MFFLGVGVLFVIVLYIGQVLGLVMQSHQIKQLKYIRGREALIPLLTYGFIPYLFRETEKGKRIKIVLWYIFRMRSKSLMIATVVSHIIQKDMEDCQKPPAIQVQVREYIPDINTGIMRSLEGRLLYA